MRKRILFPGILCLAALFSGNRIAAQSSPLTSITLKARSGNEYTVIYENAARMDFETRRPDSKDANVFLCIPGAFTTLDTYDIDGVYICKGKSGNTDKINHSLGGAIKIIDGKCDIFPTEKGKIFTDAFIKDIAKKKGSLFQQIQMITEGEAARFKDVELFQRRGIAIFYDWKIAIIESNKDITLKVFADDLVQLGVQSLLYTDMGAWDEGWYKDASGKVIALGTNHSQTSKQSNWVVFRK